MYCPECEQLFDAYLDGQLAGTLRLEFDAHRLRCRRCQQTLAMLESIGHVISSDTQVPELSSDFTNRILQEVTQPRPRVVRFSSPRVALVAAAIVQVAAVVTFVVVWQTTSIKPVTVNPPTVSPVTLVPPANKPTEAEIRGLVVEGIKERLWDIAATGTQTWSSDLQNLARYLNVPVPVDVAGESGKGLETNPIDLLLKPLYPGGAQEEPDAGISADQVHSI